MYSDDAAIGSNNIPIEISLTKNPIPVEYVKALFVIVLLLCPGCDELTDDTWPALIVRLHLMTGADSPLASTVVIFEMEDTTMHRLGNPTLMCEDLNDLTRWPEETISGQSGKSVSDSDGLVELRFKESVRRTFNHPEIGRQIRVQILEPRSPAYCIYFWDNPKIPCKVVKWHAESSERKLTEVDKFECSIVVSRTSQDQTLAEIHLNPVLDLTSPDVEDGFFYWTFSERLDGSIGWDITSSTSAMPSCE